MNESNEEGWILFTMLIFFPLLIIVIPFAFLSLLGKPETRDPFWFAATGVATTIIIATAVFLGVFGDAITGAATG